MISQTADALKSGTVVKFRLPATVPNIGVYDEHEGIVRGIYYITSSSILYIVELSTLIEGWDYDCLVVSSTDIYSDG
jgi:hypothetical protein